MYVDDNNNFCRVFEIPKIFPEGFLFGGGKAVCFMMVDWFNPIPSEDIRSGNVKEWEYYVPMLTEFLKGKTYIIPGESYLLLTDFGKSITFRG